MVGHLLSLVVSFSVYYKTANLITTETARPWLT